MSQSQQQLLIMAEILRISSLILDKNTEFTHRMKRTSMSEEQMQYLIEYNASVLKNTLQLGQYITDILNIENPDLKDIGDRLDEVTRELTAVAVPEAPPVKVPDAPDETLDEASDDLV
jgi:type IV secretory pathway VirB4 component